MLRSYVVIALRNLMRDKVVTSINIVGLSVAIAVSAILGIGVHGMLTADWNLREDDRLFRVVAREISSAGHIQRPAYQREDLAAALAETLDFDAAIRFENRTKYGMASYWGATASTYVTFHPLAERKALEAKLPEFSREFTAPVWERYKGVRWKDDPDAFLLELEDARTIYIDPQAHTYYSQEKSVSMESILALVALIGVILTVACINFTTLAVAGSIGRSAEVGVRKALGANKAQIALQFLGEGVLLAFFSLIAGTGATG